MKKIVSYMGNNSPEARAYMYICIYNLNIQNIESILLLLLLIRIL